VDTDHFADLFRGLIATPSRRAVSRAVAGLGVGSVLASFTHLNDAGAKEGHQRHHHNHRHHKRKKSPPSAQCAPSSSFCQAGDLSQCCSTASDPVSGNPYEICTDCGCCAYGHALCCQGSGAGLCCDSNGSKCCYGPNFEPACCKTDDICCGGGCCDKGETCCQTTEGVFYCCGQGLTCKQTAGITCV
jgi:hypothetical protein